MEFKLLGTIEVRDGQSLRGLGGPKQRALLAFLLLHPNAVVSRDRLIDALWGGSAGPGAGHRLESNVSRLRKALEPDGRLVSSHGGYAIEVDPMLIDTYRFEHLVEEGRRAAAAGMTSEAAQLFRKAVSLWRGDALADVAYEPFARPEIERLEELRLVALEQRIEADLALGDSGTLVGELEGLVRKHPYRERLHGQLMLALYRAGRHADALASYRELCAVLREELGLQPSTSLRELERAILNQDPALSAPSAQAATTQHLPVPATPFLGRARELAEVTALVWGSGGRLVTLTGAGGSGKTRLALRAAQACADDYRGGAWFVGFADLTDPDLIAPAICQALGIVEQPDLTPARLLEEYLRDRELLLVLDNLEQLTPGVGILGELLAGSPGVRMLATSREPLHLGGEQQYEVPVLEFEDAIELFTARAKTVAPNLIIDRDYVGAVCERLDRLPLAIELAAARTKVLSPAEILSRLERRLPVLANGPRDAPRRQRTLQGTIDWSYDLLAEQEKEHFARLSVFAGGCTLEAAETVCEVELDTLEALVDRSLMRAGAGRYWMLQTLREYALDKLERSGEADHVRRAHAQWLVEQLEAHGFGLDTFGDADTRNMHVVLVAERENFRAALEWAQRADVNETVARLAVPLSFLWHQEGRLSETDRWLAVVRARSAELPLALQARVITAARDQAWTRGAHEEADDLGEQAIALYRELGDVAGVTAEMSGQAATAAHLGDLPRARALIEGALQLARAHELNRWRSTALVNLVDIEIAEGRLDQARAHCEEAMTLARVVATDTGPALRINLAHIANLERRHADAEGLAQAALTGALAVGDLYDAAAAALMLAWALAEIRQPERAARLLGAGLEFFHEAGAAMQWSNAASEQATREALAAQLDGPTLDALIDQGRSVTLKQAAFQEAAPAGLPVDRAARA